MEHAPQESSATQKRNAIHTIYLLFGPLRRRPAIYFELSARANSRTREKATLPGSDLAPLPAQERVIFPAASHYRVITQGRFVEIMCVCLEDVNVHVLQPDETPLKQSDKDIHGS
ncbi:predicted protein [Coccidioides posadasii str. Silveira]|uniref:Predicted protein n=2 Tax=Coccidioides posadasii TaxID=199306 RepID=E9CS94_COCPS|nr:predicted protein [Coccidioides posadasii str. Silveira]KMM63896.1 hypothetical protein CPAG_00249 [Coccidioides posadasii RMSCC 3488]